MSTCQQKSSKKPWSTKEDATLLRLIDEYGSCGSWPKIALHMEWRTGKQCRERYINQLDPNIKKTPWTYEEDAVIKRLHDQLGKKWSKFMDYLPGRSDNAIKNRWHVISRDNYAEHLNRSLYSVFQSVHRGPAVKADTPDDLAAVRMARYRGDNVDAHHHDRMPPVKEETLDTLDCELIGLDSTEIDFDLCSFSEDCGGELRGAKRTQAKQNDEGATSPSMSPRTTNDLGNGNDDENIGNTSFCDYTYSASNSYHSSHSHGELSSDRDSPIDLSLLNDLLVGPEPAHNLQCNPSAALPATPDEGSTSVGTPVSPTAVASVTSPKAKPNSPTGKELQIQTNNSLYDFDYFFAHKAEGLNGGEPILHAGSLGSASAEEKGTSEQICWKYDPNEDLALALEFLMSATASPAGSSASATAPAQRGSSAPQGESNRFSTGGNNTAASQATGGAVRSPNSSWYAMRETNSPAGSLRIRPFSGNLASMASMLARSGSNSSNSRLACDPELERVPVPVQPAASLSSRPLPTAPAPPVGAPASGGFAWQAPQHRAMHQSAMPEHSPMNHTHFSPSCPNSKRSRSKNPATFSW